MSMWGTMHEEHCLGSPCTQVCMQRMPAATTSKTIYLLTGMRSMHCIEPGYSSKVTAIHLSTAPSILRPGWPSIPRILRPARQSRSRPGCLFVQSKAELLANVTRWLAGNTACLAVVRIQAQTVINHLSAALAGTPLLDVPEVVECLCSEGKDHSHAFGDLPPGLAESGVPTQWMGCKDHLHPVSPPPRNHPSVRARHEHRLSVLRAQERVLVAKGLAYSLQNNPMQRAVTPAFTDRIARHAWHSMVTGHSSPVTREQQLRARIFVDVATLVRVGIVHADGEALAARVASEGRSHGHCVAGLRLSSQTVEDSIATALTSEFWTGTGADGRAQGRTGRVRFWVVGGLGVLYDAQWVQLQHAEHTGRPATPSVLVPSAWDLVRRTFFKYHTHVIIDGNKLSPV